VYRVDPKVSVCFVVLESSEVSEKAREELKKAIALLGKLSYWEIEKVTLFEDQRMMKLK